MIAGVRLKVCGLTSPGDAATAVAIGADFLGFILYPKSPRYLSLRQFAALQPELPAHPKVAVMVAPQPEEVAAAAAAGFDRFQIHFPVTSFTALRTAVAGLAPERIWLAPRLAPGEAIPAAELRAGSTWLLDTYRADRIGGTGETGDWGQFRRWQEDHPQCTWILAGGLAPENVGAALAATGARFIDVNSGVERTPGVKDPDRLAALRTALTNAAA